MLFYFFFCIFNFILYFIHASEYNGRHLAADWSPVPGLSTAPQRSALRSDLWGGDPLPSTSPKGPWVRWLWGAIT